MTGHRTVVYFRTRISIEGWRCERSRVSGGICKAKAHRLELCRCSFCSELARST